MEASLTDLDLVELQVANLFTHDAEGRMVADNEPDGDPAPRFFLWRTREGNAWRVRHDVPEHIVQRLHALVAAEPVPDDLQAPPVCLDAALDALRLDDEPVVGHHGPHYRFPAGMPVPDGVTRITRENLHLLRRMVGRIDALDRDFDHVEPWMSMVVDGAAVASCFSSRLTDRAAEARVDTLEEYRGRGYAPAVVAAWARAVRDSGRVPFYGTSWDNTASQAVARKLNLVQFGVGLALA
jgi:GNAT superfamily N-acetyltransferase